MSVASIIRAIANKHLKNVGKFVPKFHEQNATRGYKPTLNGVVPHGLSLLGFFKYEFAIELPLAPNIQKSGWFTLTMLGWMNLKT